MKDFVRLNLITGSQLKPERSLRDTALSGGLWTGAQVVVNKVVSLGGTVVMMYLDEF